MSSLRDASAQGLATRTQGLLRHLGLLRFAGPDALAFLQGQVSNDTRLLAQGAPILAAYSSAQGRVLAILDLLPHSSGILAIMPRELVLPVRERLSKFVLRAKVKIEDVSSQFEIAGAHDGATLEAMIGTAAPGAGRSYLEHDGSAVALTPLARTAIAAGAESPRFWVIRPGVGMTDPAREIDADAELAWRLADIRAGVPQVYAATSEAFVAQMLNLDLLEAISFSKGCYTGQEIIARTQHLGRIKRRMFRLELPAGPWSIGQALRLADGRSGKLVELAVAEERIEALAVLPLEPSAAADAGDETRVTSAIELALPYSPTATPAG